MTWTKSYTKDEIEIDLLCESISSELSLFESITFNNYGDPNLFVVFESELSAEEQATLDVIVTNHDGALLKAKRDKYYEIDKKTTELIGNGFSFDDTLFSLSQEAQMRMVGITQVREMPQVTYPIKWNSKKDDSVYDVANSSNLLGMFLTGLGTYRAHVDSGTALKNLVRAATTKAEVEAIVDPR